MFEQIYNKIHQYYEKFHSYKFGFKEYIIILYLIFLIIYGFNAFLKNYGYKTKKNIKNKHIFLTGALGGIGSRLSIFLGQKGSKLTLVDIQKQKYQQLKIIFQQKNIEHKVYFTDICNKSEIQNIIKISIQQYGPIDILINNAGIKNQGSLKNKNINNIENLFKVNILSHFNLIKLVLPDMMKNEKGGHIIEISSAAGIFGCQNIADYCSSKSAIIGLSQSLRKQLKDSKVKITCICPYYIRTGMFQKNLKYPFYKPILQQDWACRRIMWAILQQQEMVLLPWKLHIFVALKALLPYSVANKSMIIL